MKPELNNPATKQLNLDTAQALDKGMALHQKGDTQGAEAIYQRIIAQDPQHAFALHLLGVLRAQQKNYDAAIELLDRAIAIDDSVAEFHLNRGTAFKSKKVYAEAIASYERALRLQPDYPSAHFNLGNTRLDMEQWQQAIGHYRLALSLEPKDPHIYYNMGLAYAALKNAKQAQHCYEQVLRYNPNFLLALFNLGSMYKDQDQPKRALSLYKRILAIDPNHVKTYINQGGGHQVLNQLDAALNSYDKAIALEPHNPLAHWNRALALLVMGRYDEGWVEYEWRWQYKAFIKDHEQTYPHPLWDGAPLAGRRLLIHYEQGIGDSLQFIRYIPLIQREPNDKIYLLCQAELISLLEKETWHDGVFSEDQPLPDVEVRMPIMSLPRLFKTNLHNIPNNMPYISISTERRQQWAQRLAPFSGLKVGLVWAGNPNHNNDRNRSMPLATLKPLMSLKGIDFFSLQKGDAQRELAKSQMPITDLGSELTDFTHTAAALEQLDLLISVDTAVAHLPGALNQPAWTLLAFSPDWRWLLKRADSPWYPSMQLFRQIQPQCWDDVIHALRKSLKDLLAQHKQAS